MSRLTQLVHNALLILLLALSPLAFGQTQNEEAAYFRLFLSPDKNRPDLLIDLFIDGQPTPNRLAAGQFPPFIKLPAGRHNLAIHLPGQSSAVRTLAVEVIPGSNLTVALNNLLPATAPLSFMDSPPSGRRQTQLNVYHLDTSGFPVDVLSSKGGRIFSALSPGQRASQIVNPVKVELTLARAGQIMALAEQDIKLSAGRSYSVFFMPESGRGKRIIAGEDIFPAGYTRP